MTRRAPVHLTVLLALLHPGCAPPSGAAEGEAAPLSSADRSALEAEVMAADRAFARSTRERGLEGWLAHMAEDAARVDLAGETARGHEAIRRMDGPLFDDPDLALEWEPTEALVFADGRTAFTRGPYRLLGPAPGGSGDTILARGNYLTVWRKDADGWTVILDTGAPEPAG